MVTLGKFKVGEEVKMRNRKAYGAERTGRVVEFTPNRVRVLWEPRNGIAGKRTWMAPAALVQVVRGSPDPFPEPGDELPEAV